jgi:hypothetical protein
VTAQVTVRLSRDSGFGVRDSGSGIRGRAARGASGGDAARHAGQGAGSTSGRWTLGSRDAIQAAALNIAGSLRCRTLSPLTRVGMARGVAV